MTMVQGEAFLDDQHNNSLFVSNFCLKYSASEYRQYRSHNNSFSVMNEEHTGDQSLVFFKPANGSEIAANRSPAAFVIISITIVASTYGLARYCYGLFLPYIQQDFDLSRDVLGLIACFIRRLSFGNRAWRHCN